MSRRRLILALASAALLAIVALTVTRCHRTAPAPHRVDTAVEFPREASTIVVPIAARLADLQRGLDAAVPETLWTIDRVEPACIPAQRLKLFGKKLKVTPDLSCRIVGRVTRGALRLAGSGQTLRVTMPVHATISARNIGGIVKQQTATGAATVHADIKLAVHPDWTPVATATIDYDWTEPPGVTLFGKRITFVDKADDKLKGVIAKLERDLPSELARLDTHAKVAEAWRQGFTSILLNRDNPPVWLRISPQQASFDGYRITGDRIELTAAARAVTETFIGQRPPDPVPTQLPPLSRAVAAPSLAFAVPVLADYAELEPVVARALVKLDARGITLPHLGRVDAAFGKVTMYATDGGRLAVGVAVKAKLRSGLLGPTTGEVWLTGLPFNQPDSQVIEIRDLRASSRTDSQSIDLLLAIVEQPAFLETVRGALTQNFAKDYAKVLTSARAAIGDKRLGDFVLSARIDRVTHGRVLPTGQGLYLPVRAEGNATITYRPRSSPHS